MKIERESDPPRAFADLAREAFDAGVVRPSLSVQVTSDLALRHRLPAASANRGFAPQAVC